jgi:hypothetical protein
LVRNRPTVGRHAATASTVLAVAFAARGAARLADLILAVALRIGLAHGRAALLTLPTALLLLLALATLPRGAAATVGLALLAITDARLLALLLVRVGRTLFAPLRLFVAARIVAVAFVSHVFLLAELPGSDTLTGV